MPSLAQLENSGIIIVKIILEPSDAGGNELTFQNAVVDDQYLQLYCHSGSIMV